MGVVVGESVLRMFYHVGRRMCIQVMGNVAMDGWRWMSGLYARKRHVIFPMRLGNHWGRLRATCVPNVVGGTERRCREAGVVFQPMIFESLGGVSVEADRVINCPNKAVASTTDSPEGKSQLCVGTVLG